MRIPKECGSCWGTGFLGGGWELDGTPQRRECSNCEGRGWNTEECSQAEFEAQHPETQRNLLAFNAALERN